jgi:ubiquinone/menaquinone biosynthesis C-methylase UbiE
MHTRLGDWDNYYRVAEGQFSEQWDEVIWPAIQDFEFTTTLELSPGGGRNTERLCTLASRLIAVDYNQDPLNRTQARLGTTQGECGITYYRNNGSDLSMVSDESVTAVYCWDAAVHFDKDVVRSYIGEFARVLIPGGRGFLHHSDLGDGAHKNIQRNPDWRSNTSKELVAEACRVNGLTDTMQQPVHWRWSMDSGRSRDTVDYITVFRKVA